MSLPRFFVNAPLPDTGEAQLDISSGELRHMTVRRLTCGERIALTYADGSSWEAELVSLTAEGATVRVVGALAHERTCNLTLVQGVSKGDRMTQTIRQCTEIGVARIVPFLSERSVVRLKGADIHKKGERWRGIAAEASKQSGRSSVPAIDDPASLDFVLETLSGYDRVIVAWEVAGFGDEPSVSMGEALAGLDSDSRIALVIGPEGGLSAHEVDALLGCGEDTRLVTLGDLILRTETAAVVASALASYLLGGMGNES